MRKLQSIKPVISLRTLPAFFFLLVFVGARAQAPQWTEDSKRQSLYPNDKFLTGYYWEENVKKKEVEDVLYQLVAQAKSELLESITVDIKTESNSAVADYGDEFYESFSSKTNSSSGLKLIGLEVEKYYDPQAKKAYGFAYVSRQSLYDHYHGLIRDAIRELSQGISTSEIYLSTGDPELAMEAIIHGDSLSPQIALGQKTLEVLGYRSDMDQKTTEIAEVQAKRQTQLKKIHSSPKMTVNAAAFQKAYNLLHGFELDKSKLEVQGFSYEGSGMNSPMGHDLKKSVSEQLGKIEQVKEPRKDELDLHGSWRINGDIIEITLEAINAEGKTVAASKSAMAKQHLEEDYYLPPGAKRLQKIESIEIKLSSSEFSGICQKPILAQIKGLVLNSIPGTAIPLQIRNVTSGEVIKFLSNDNGSFSFKIDKIRSCKATQILFVEIDLAGYLQLDENSSFIERVIKERKLPSSRMIWNIAGPKITFQVNESQNGVALGVPIITPLLKEELSKMGFNFTSNAAEAELMITVNARARNGGNMQSLYFSYCDAEVIVTDMATGAEILNEAYNGVKDAGGNFDQAGMKAFKKVGDTITKKVVTRLNE